jgi:hypothetical protein
VSTDALALILTLIIIIPVSAVGVWFGLRLVRGSDLRRDQPRLKKIVIGIWIAAVAAAGVWLASGDQLSFANASFGFVLASIAIFIVFRRPKGS